jgi:NAD(P)-dependent dehydrogenase (short-subunit alcohol dehydrogenase family)
MTQSPQDVQLKAELTGDVALVTGANRGIGAELADLGATVYAGARDTADITATNQHAVKLDVSDDEEINSAIDRIAEGHGSLDILVNNAGVSFRSGPLREMKRADYDRTMAVNLRSPSR